MEIVKENKFTKWKHIIKKLHTTKIADPNRLDTIETELEKGKEPIHNDIEYLEEKHEQLQEYKTINQNEPILKEEKSPNFERELEIIKQLHQKEIGNFSRIESIKNYLIDGMPLLHEDNMYLKEQFEQLQKLLGTNNEYAPTKKSKTRDEPLKPQAILIDDVESHPTRDFISLSKTISKLIRDSSPHFTIGIYGEWGTGKTTLMKCIESDLVDDQVDKHHQKIFPIWFNAWKYEREDSLATISLLKTVAYSLENHVKFDPLSKIIFKGLTIVGKDLMQQIAMQVVSKEHPNANSEIDEKMHYLNKLYRDSVYYEGLDNIKQQLEEIRAEDGDYRVVVFIDDLDRCSANKALEVLESIKLFLDMEGFVFIIGLSHKTVTQLITHAYQQTGVKGEDYIKKIIQIPIKIPSWTKENIIDLIGHSIVPRLNSDYTSFMHQNSAMVARVIDYNPRQLKRFINNVIIAFETFASKQGSPDIQFNDIFLAKILKSEWPDFYQEFIHNNDFRDIIKWMTTRPQDLRKYFRYIKTITEELPVEQKNKRMMLLAKLQERTQGRIDSNLISVLAEFDNDTWIFFDNVKDVLFGIENWKIIDSVMDVVEEFSYDLPIGANKSKTKTPKPVTPNSS